MRLPWKRNKRNPDVHFVVGQLAVVLVPSDEGAFRMTGGVITAFVPGESLSLQVLSLKGEEVGRIEKFDLAGIRRVDVHDPPRRFSDAGPVLARMRFGMAMDVFGGKFDSSE